MYKFVCEPEALYAMAYGDQSRSSHSGFRYDPAFGLIGGFPHHYAPTAASVPPHSTPAMPPDMASMAGDPGSFGFAAAAAAAAAAACSYAQHCYSSSAMVAAGVGGEHVMGENGMLDAGNVHQHHQATIPYGVHHHHYQHGQFSPQSSSHDHQPHLGKFEFSRILTPVF